MGLFCCIFSAMLILWWAFHRNKNFHFPHFDGGQVRVFAENELGRSKEGRVLQVNHQHYNQHHHHHHQQHQQHQQHHQTQQHHQHYQHLHTQHGLGQTFLLVHDHNIRVHPDYLNHSLEPMGRDQRARQGELTLSEYLTEHSTGHLCNVMSYFCQSQDDHSHQ